MHAEADTHGCPTSEAGASSVASWAAPGPLAKVAKRGLTTALQFLGIGTSRNSKALSVFTSPMALQAEIVTDAPVAAALQARMTGMRASRAPSHAAKRSPLDAWSELSSPGASSKMRRRSSGSSSAGSLQVTSLPGIHSVQDAGRSALSKSAGTNGRQARHHAGTGGHVREPSVGEQARRSVTQLQRLSGTLLPGVASQLEAGAPDSRSSSPARRQQAAKSISQLDMLMQPRPGQAQSIQAHREAAATHEGSDEHYAMNPATVQQMRYQDSVSYLPPAHLEAGGTGLAVAERYGNPAATAQSGTGSGLGGLQPFPDNSIGAYREPRQWPVGAQRADQRSTAQAYNDVLVSRAGQVLQDGM